MKDNFTNFTTDFTDNINLIDIKEKLIKEDNIELENKNLKLFESLYEEGKIKNEDILNWLEEPTNEGILGQIFGGLTGLALGKKLGKIIANILGIQKGILYDLLTSRIFGAAIGSSIGKQF